MKKITAGIAFIMMITAGTLLAQSTKKSSRVKNLADTTRAMRAGDIRKDSLMDGKNPGLTTQQAEIDTPRTNTQSQGSGSQGTSAWPQATGTAATLKETEMSDTARTSTQSQTGVVGAATTQTQGNSSQGTSAWPLATGTAGSTTLAPDSAGKYKVVSEKSLKKQTKKGKKKDEPKSSGDSEK